MEIDEEASQLANEHIEWFISMLRPLLFSHFVHGYKHGVESKNDIRQNLQPQCTTNSAEESAKPSEGFEEY